MNRCPACGAADVAYQFRTPEMPVNSCVLTRDRAASLGYARAPLEIWSCAGCGFLWNAAFDPRHVTYDESYEATQGHSTLFRQYLKDLARGWLARAADAPGSILEVGCGQGEFLGALAPLTDAELVGYDPASRGPAPGRPHIVPQKLPKEAGRCFDMVINRMTLEHIEAPLDFLRIMAAWLAPGGTLVTQVPDARRTLDEGRPCDLFYEHVNYFTPSALLALHRRAGFEQIDVETGYDGQHLTVFAHMGGPAPETAPTNVMKPDRLRDRCDGFAEEWRIRLEAARRDGRDIWLWGTGSRATTFLALLGAEVPIAGAIDINPARQGTYVLGSACETFLPEVLSGRSDLAVVVMNPIYKAEIRSALKSVHARAALLLLE